MYITPWREEWVKIRNVIIIFIMALILTLYGCSKIENGNSQIILDGYNLLDLGLEIKTNELTLFNDPNNPKYLPIYGVLHISNEVEYVFSDGKLNDYGNLTVLGLYYCDDKISMNFLPILYIQAFVKVPQKEALFRINEQLYNKKELELSKLYEDQKVIVVDVTSFLPVKEFENKVKVLTEQGFEDYNYNWFYHVYQYLKIYKTWLMQLM